MKKLFKMPPTTITHKNGGIEQAFLEIANEDGILSDESKKRLEYLKSLPQDRTELMSDQTLAWYIKHNQETDELENGTQAIEDFERRMNDYEEQRLFEYGNDF